MRQRPVATRLAAATLALAGWLAAVGGLGTAAAEGEAGAVAAFGSAPAVQPDPPLGATTTATAAVAGMAADPDGGYWLVTAGGAVRPVGGASAHGSVDGPLAQPVVGMAAAPDGDGYWLVASDGGVFAFGTARFLGSTGAVRLNRPVVGMAAAPSGDGYWLVASDGGVFAFGTARFLGSTGAVRLNRPVVGMAVAPSGDGYWLAASDGGVFAFGTARFLGSTGHLAVVQPVVAVAATGEGDGYWLVAADGGVFAFGDAPFLGSLGGRCLAEPVRAVAVTPGGDGYWMAHSTVEPWPRPGPGDPPLAALATEAEHIAGRLRLRQACQPPSEPRRGALAHPLPGARVTTRFGPRTHPIFRVPQLHTGVDFAAGGSARAAAPGVVASVVDRVGYGVTVVVQHDGGVGTVYAHLRRPLVAVGQQVSAGQPVGEVGATGFATGAHLHFEVRVLGVPTDPLAWL